MAECLVLFESHHQLAVVPENVNYHLPRQGRCIQEQAFQGLSSCSYSPAADFSQPRLRPRAPLEIYFLEYTAGLAINKAAKYIL
jgi:hypothetical protein